MLEARGLRPRKRHGQCFLADPALADAIVADAELRPDDVVVEIGPGAGGLTQPLLKSCAHVTAIELDRGLTELLRERLGADERLTLIEGDALARGEPGGLHPAIVEGLGRAAGGGGGHVVANLPYSVGTAIVARLLQLPAPPVSITAMLQREVVDRLRAETGVRAYGPLAVLTALHGGARVLRRVPRDVFLPRPDVESAVFRIVPRPEAVEGAAAASELARRGFQARRKRVRRTLRDVLSDDAFDACGVATDARPEHVPPAAWRDLAARAKDVAG